MNKTKEIHPNKKYANTKLILSVFSFCFDFILLIVLYFSGFTSFLASKFSFLIFVLIFDIILKCFSFPLSFYSGFVLEHKFKLSNQTFLSFMKQKCKSDILGMIVFVFFISIIYLLFYKALQNWWLFIWLIWNFFNMFVAFLFPNLILPLFYKLTKINDPKILTAIEELCKATGFNKFSSDKIYAINLGKDTVKANAAVIGFGKTRKIVLSDTLLQNFSVEEIMAVLAHEIGHAKRKHILKVMLSSFVVSFVFLWISQGLLVNFLQALGVTNLMDLSALPLVLLYFILIFFVLSPLHNFISRKMEVEADDFSVTHYPKEHFISAMERLSTLNLADDEPHPLIEFLLYSHPAIKRRIDYAKNTE
ncbi:MAG: M48 family metallopeptidase [bacterium]|nr:M48 family metallopeptidase [bacterium]